MWPFQNLKKAQGEKERIIIFIIFPYWNGMGFVS